MTYRVTKTYGHECGLSATFRQWRADSHCRLVHGYALAITLIFEADELDDRNWVIDFGGLKPVRRWIEDMFDHATLIAKDDPHLSFFKLAEQVGVIKLHVVPAVGCEAFAALVFRHVEQWLGTARLASRVRIAEVIVREHGANAAHYVG